jgi:hypothetical protein
MSTILVDHRGNPLVADPVGPMYGPMRFEDQPASVRRRGRKGKALRGRRGTSRRSQRATRRGRKSARSRNRRDYRKFLSQRAGTYGPVRFEDQPTWVRRRGRKSKAVAARRGRKSASRSTRRSARRSATSSRSVRSMRRSGQITRRQARKLNRQLARQQRSRKGRKSSRRSGKSLSRRSRKGSRRLSRRSSSGAGKVLTYNSLMSQLRKRRGLKAWVCVGRKRTGCGGGRKGYRGSRQLGVLRP